MMLCVPQVGEVQTRTASGTACGLSSHLHCSVQSEWLCEKDSEVVLLRGCCVTETQRSSRRTDTCRHRRQAHMWCTW
jgi:hypothetical protein